ncbi:hypothetical protein HQ865_02310 [Mucilaginibacter mali]|uniref:Uncharacterized protein n=1 Tax=Mucilaginibacter mali TaxID=2740462 RepID=A0A7D4UE62_9SPHI|nr:hypothetical protein [Mucilaginibacter mali]QKJ28636.1 hypothetical protein HQ865_02310 [Mucilaginibacter mali]
MHYKTQVTKIRLFHEVYVKPMLTGTINIIVGLIMPTLDEMQNVFIFDIKISSANNPN